MYTPEFINLRLSTIRDEIKKAQRSAAKYKRQALALSNLEFALRNLLKDPADEGLNFMVSRAIEDARVAASDLPNIREVTKSVIVTKSDCPDPQAHVKREIKSEGKKKKRFFFW